MKLPGRAAQDVWAGANALSRQMVSDGNRSDGLLTVSVLSAMPAYMVTGSVNITGIATTSADCSG
jgi:hypothetical protein